MGAWLLAQIATQIFPFFNVPNSAVRFVIVALILGFPVAMVLSWLFELTPEGIVRTEDVDLATQRGFGRKLDFVIIGVLLLVIGMLIYQRLPFRTESGEVIPNKSIAVLPFENRSEDKANAYFADGIQDEILTRLSKIANLKVISRTSTQHYKSAPENLPEIARQLGVAHILEGSVQKSGDAVRVNVQLIKAANDSHLWADTFDRKLTDIFSVESEIGKAIADQLRAKLTRREEQAIAAKPTDNVEAYDAYLRGLAYCHRPGYSGADILDAIKSFRKAVQLDPNFALAWAWLARESAAGYFNKIGDDVPALREAAKRAADKALNLQPNLGEVYLAQGYSHYYGEDDYDGAIALFEKASELSPNNSEITQALALVCRRKGEWQRSLDYFRQAIKFDPKNAALLAAQAETYQTLRQFGSALKVYDQVLDIIPGNAETIVAKASVYQGQGNLQAAGALLAPLHPPADDPSALEAQIYQAILERRPAPIIPRLKEILARPNPAGGYINGELRFWLGWAQEVAGERAGAQESWRQARSELGPLLEEGNVAVVCDLALTNMGLGDKAAALALLERAMAALPIEKDALNGPIPIEALARVAAQVGEPDRAIAALQKLLSIPYQSQFATGVPLTAALLRLDPMFDPLRNDPRFQKLCEEKL
jgi:TolB-like protein/predicted Zn-dependent protease